MANEVLTVVKRTPVLAGVCGTDPFRQMPHFLKQIKEIGFCGVQNFPTVGLIDGNFRQNLEETGMGYQLEVEMIRLARQMELFTSPYAFNPAEAREMAAAGADVVVAHAGLTTKGSIGASTAQTLEQCVDFVQAIADSAKSVNPETIVLCHGGPISMPEDAQFILHRTAASMAYGRIQHGTAAGGNRHHNPDQAVQGNGFKERFTPKKKAVGVRRPSSFKLYWFICGAIKARPPSRHATMTARNRLAVNGCDAGLITRCKEKLRPMPMLVFTAARDRAGMPICRWRCRTKAATGSENDCSSAHGRDAIDRRRVLRIRGATVAQPGR
jgi:hypothetical protein